MNLRVISDCHGHFNKYYDIVKPVEYSLQLGDFGGHIAYGLLEASGLDHNKHKLFAGNHENWNSYVLCKHALGHYGPITCFPTSKKLFFVRGAFSIDRKYQISRGIYNYDEELNHKQQEECYNSYIEYKPEIVFSHTCPNEVEKLIGNRTILKDFGFDPDRFSTKTGELLQKMFEAHQPEMWFIAHFHKNWSQVIKTTTFVCMQELGYYDLKL